MRFPCMLVISLTVHLVMAMDWCLPDCSCTEEELGTRIADCSRKHLMNVDSDMLGEELFIQVLDLSYNLLAELPDDFPDMMKGRWRLTALSLSNNVISFVSSFALRGLTSLRALDLSNNRITTLPRDFLLVTPSVRALSLDGNHLHEVTSSSLLNAPYLTRLSLTRCNLAHLTSAALFNLPSLQTLDLSENQLMELPDELPPLLQQLDVFDNPLRCSDPIVKSYLSKIKQIHSDCIVSQDSNQPKRSEAIIAQDPNQPKRSEAIIKVTRISIFDGLLCAIDADSAHITDNNSEFSDERNFETVLNSSITTCTRKHPKWLYLWGIPALWAAIAGFLLGIFVSAYVWCSFTNSCKHKYGQRHTSRTLSLGRSFNDTALLLGESTAASLFVEDLSQSTASLLAEDLGQSTASFLVEDIHLPPGTPPPPYSRNSENTDLFTM